MKKLYIIFTYNIHFIGGSQLYCAGKIKYLCEKGWDVVVLFNGTNWGSCVVPSLRKYVDGGNRVFSLYPFLFDRESLDVIFYYYYHKYRFYLYDSQNIVIESQDAVFALWGELFAQKLNAKHGLVLVNEDFDIPQYRDNRKFLFNMLSRKSLIPCDVGQFKEIFGDIVQVECESNILSGAYEECPIQEVYSELFDRVERKDFNIAYIGRAEKVFVPKVLEGVRDFANDHIDKSILLIMVGNINNIEKTLEAKISSCKNITLFATGDLYPIPKKLFERVDVVIAASQSALFAADEKVPVIVADCINSMSNGVLGYSCAYEDVVKQNDSYKQTTFYEALEDVLVTKEYLTYPHILPLEINVGQEYSKQIEFIQRSETKYYDVLKSDKKVIYSVKLTNIMKRNDFLNRWDSGKSRKIVFGAGNYGGICLEWMNYTGRDFDIFVDNDRNKVGGCRGKYKIEAPDEIKPDDMVIVANMLNVNEISRQLLENRVEEKNFISLDELMSDIYIKFL